MVKIHQPEKLLQSPEKNWHSATVRKFNLLNTQAKVQSGMHPLTGLTFNPYEPKYNWHAATVKRHVQDQSGIHPLTGLSTVQV